MRIPKIKIPRIKIDVRSALKSLLMNLVNRAVWSILISISAAFASILIARVLGSTQNIAQLFSANFFPLFEAFFIGSFTLLLIPYIFSSISELDWEPKFAERIEKRIRKGNRETRSLIAHGLKWTRRCILVLMFLLLLIVAVETSAQDKTSQDESFSQRAFWSFVVLYFVFATSMMFTASIMAPRDWAILHLERFMKSLKKDVVLREELMSAFASYNRILGSSLTMPKLVSIVGHIIEAHKIGTSIDRKEIQQAIDNLVRYLKKEKISEANSQLIALSELTMNTTAKHEKVLGFEVKYPLRYRIMDTFKGLMGKLLANLMLILLWILILIILAYLGWLPEVPLRPPI